MKHKMTTLDIDNYVGSPGFQLLTQEHLDSMDSEGWEMVSSHLKSYPNLGSTPSVDLVFFWKRQD